MTTQAIMDRVTAYGVKFTDSLYQLSVFAILAGGGALLLLGFVGAAVALGAVDVPEFHPK